LPKDIPCRIDATLPEDDELSVNLANPIRRFSRLRFFEECQAPHVTFVQRSIAMIIHVEASRAIGICESQKYWYVECIAYP
jgi:hypothetical protein